MHRITQTTYPATDCELNILGVLHAHSELSDFGEWEMSSGARVTLDDEGNGMAAIYVEGDVLVSDLPEYMRECVRRMDPAAQPEREQRLYELWASDRRGEDGGPSVL
jgi:hypothetical protein